SGARLAVRLITAKNQSCGTFITPFIPGKFRPTPIRNDATRYAFTFDYDPRAAARRGRFTFTLASDAHRPGELEKPDLPDAFKQEARRRFPSTTTFAVDLPEGFKRQGTAFDHFGLMNLMKAGGRSSIYFDDLRYDGRSQDFTRDPNWDASGNRPPYKAVHVGGPTRVGHYFHPSLSTAEGTRGQAAAGPVLEPNKVYDWSLIYDPIAEGGQGAIRVTLGPESVTLVLKKGVKAQGGRFDRF